MNYFYGLLFAFALGFFCRLLNIPMPAPPTLFGCALIAAITIGYMCGGRWR